MTAPHQDFLASIQERHEQLDQTKRIWSLATSLAAQSSSNSNKNVSVDHHRVLRSLKTAEVTTLKTTCGCKSQDWSQVLLLLESSISSTAASIEQYLKDRVSNTTFDGVVVLSIEYYSSPTNKIAKPKTKKSDRFSLCLLDPWRKGKQGIHNNFLVSNSILSAQSWICNNALIRDTHILPESVVVGCGSLTASSNPKFLALPQKVGGGGGGDIYDGSTIALTVGPESGGGRSLLLQPECDMIQVCQQLVNKNKSVLAGEKAEKLTNNNNSTKMNVISSFCLIRNTPSIQGIYLAPNSSIQGATSVIDAILFPTSTIQNSCSVENVRLQWKASITDNSKVSDTMLMEEAHIGPNSLVASSVLGPDVHVSAGEVHCSIIGPNTNAHHQSLVISVLWPLGRGNVGYGGNIGSNHTGRIPDQETSSGEGVFWGLSCVIKFPVDLTMAPYSIVAAGTALPPQRVCMPFSLIVSSNDASGNNNIIPGWVLSSSPYTVARSETKYATRRKALRHKHYTGWKIIRPETIAMCQWARKQLENVAATEETPLTTAYATDRAVGGIGSNILSEKGRRTGIKTYSDCIQKFALEGLLSWIMNQEAQGRIDGGRVQDEFRTSQPGTAFFDMDTVHDRVMWPAFPWETKSDQLWAYKKQLLQEEFPCEGDIIEWVCELLQTLVGLEKEYASKIYKCKKRDDQRGAKTVPGYEECHTPAEEDPVIKQASKDAEEVESAVTQIVAKMEKRFRSKL